MTNQHQATSRYQVFDLEVENHKTYKRFCNPFDPINYVVARGWKFQGDKQCSWSYHTGHDGKRLHIPTDITLLVGHNIKFDLLFEWKNPELIAFFKRGGRIWDTQYVEYLLEGARNEFHMIAMDKIAVKYGGRVKIDAVKELWEQGWLTSAIDKDMLIDYLVGTEAEGRDSGDIGNTEKIFLGQLKRVQELGMATMIFARMDGLCATTEMEYNGLKIDVNEASRRLKIMNQELLETEVALSAYIPELPEGLEFNWASGVHSSCLIFGGAIAYRRKSTYIDPSTGELARTKAYEDWYLIDGVPIDPSICRIGNMTLDIFTSGKKKGELKTKRVEVLGPLKERMTDFIFDLPGYTVPNKKWELGASTDARDEPIYSTDASVIEELGTRDIPFLKLVSKRASLVKDLGVYYTRWDPKKKAWVGMLTCVMTDTHCIHHNLNHTATVTTRLSSDNPNLQNIPKEDTSEVKKMFISRFPGGKMIEADYTQLEVVIQAMLSQDKQLVLDLINKVDFHCKRVSAWKKITYEEALYRCKDETYPDHKVWKRFRTDAKVFSFQRAYGAGAAKIAETTGMDIEDVKALIEAEESLYSGVTVFNNSVEETVKKSAVPFRDPIRGNRPYRRGYWQSPTKTLYSWRSYDAPAFLAKKGIQDTFKPTELKNYPIQGTGGEVVQTQLGLLWRHFLANDNYSGRALLCNTVHDCVWIDSHPDVIMEVARDTKRILEDVPNTFHRLYGFMSPVPFPCEVEIGDNLYTKEVLHLNKAA